MTWQRVQKLKVRPSVENFANAIERSLRRNDSKGGWFKCKPLWLMCRLQEEMGELARELRVFDLVDPASVTKLEQERIVRECADVAAFAMMIADVAKGMSLHTSDEATPIVAQWYGETREWSPGVDFTLPLPGEKDQELWRSRLREFNEQEGSST